MKTGLHTRARSLQSYTLAGGLLLSMVAIIIFARATGIVGAAACTVPSVDNGTASLSMSLPATSDYTVWTRMMVPDTTRTSVNVEIDGNTCYSVGGGTAITPNTWTWVRYQNGSTANIIRPNLTQGTHAVKYVGTSNGVLVDRIILASDVNCTPTGTGDDCASGDATPPTAAITAPAAAANLTGTTTLSATASDASSGVASVDFMVDGTVIGTDTASPYTFSWNTATVANGTHSIQVRATDKAGNAGTSTVVSVNVTNTLPCTASPTAPTNVRSTSTGMTSVSLAWNASQPASGCVLSGYKIYRDGVFLKAVPSGLTYTDTGLVMNKTYSYTVSATDSTGHESAKSTALSVQTLNDTTAPTAPAGVSASLTTANQVALTWPASTDNVGTIGYYIYRDGLQVGQSSTPSYTDTSLRPGTTYKYTFRAFDAANNLSAYSPAFNFATLAGTAANKGDVNGSGKVDLSDLSVLLNNWKANGAPVTKGDLNGDGVVDLTDLSILLSNWDKSV